MTIPKAQHWIPRFYLSHFAAQTTRKGEAQVWIFAKDYRGPDPVLVSVSKICQQRHLYAPAAPGELRSGKLEAELANLESLLSPFWPLAATDFLDLGDHAVRKGLALFMATLFLRHPQHIASVAAVHRQIVDAVKNSPVDETGAPAIQSLLIGEREVPFDTTGWNAFLARTDLDHHKAFVASVREHAIHIAELLMAKRWSVVVADGPLFITSDNCVAAHNPERENFGLGTPGTLMTFPLSPTRVLLLDDHHQEPANQYYPLRGNDPAPFNFTIWRGAMNLMISSRSPDDVLREFDAMTGGVPLP